MAPSMTANNSLDTGSKYCDVAGEPVPVSRERAWGSGRFLYGLGQSCLVPSFLQENLAADVDR